MAFKVPEKYRTATGYLPTTEADGNNGMFFVPFKNNKTPLKVVAGDMYGWEHVSVSLPNRCPTWEEMCHIKDLFWGEDDVVVQFHPAKKEYINNHPYCLHLWRPVDEKIPVPHKLLVGL